MRKTGCLLALSCAGAAFVTFPASAEIGGRYATQPPVKAPNAEAVPPPSETRVMEIAAHRHAYAVSYQIAGNRHKHRGWGLLDGDQLAVALSTGGAAYGVGIYHHVPTEHDWSGPWMSSLDGGAAVGTIHFAEGVSLEGRHTLVCARPGAGSVSGTVEIKAVADGYQLRFNLGRVVFYRGVGVMLPGERLAVGWSFGSAPDLATYAVGAGGTLAEHHVSWTPHPENSASAQFRPLSDDQYFAVINEGTPNSGPGSSRMPLFANPAGPSAEDVPTGDAASGSDALAPAVGPVAPQVKAWGYAALMRQYGADGWAQRWLERQLTQEELRLLHAALRRQEAQAAAAQGLETRSIETMIEDERGRESRR